MTREEHILNLESIDCDGWNVSAEAKESLEWVISKLKENKEEPIYYPPCIDCNKKMDEIRRTYDKLKKIPSAENKGDLISRQTVLNLKQTFTDNAGYETEYIDVEDIKELPSIPSVENKGEWIPVSERLPKDDEDVLVYCGQYSGQGMMNIAYYHNDYTFYPSEYADLNETGWYDENDDAMYHEPIAWMPLPEPYKKGDDK